MTNAERLRAGRERRAAAEGRALRPYRRREPMTEEQRIERRHAERLAQRMEKARQEGKAYRVREDLRGYHSAHVMLWRKVLRQKAGGIVNPGLYIHRRSLHEAHVLRYRQASAWRARYASNPDHHKALYAARYANDTAKERARSSNRKRACPDSYVIQQLKAMGWAREACTPEVVELKRELILLRRSSRTLKAAVVKHKEQTK